MVETDPCLALRTIAGRPTVFDVFSDESGDSALSLWCDGSHFFLRFATAREARSFLSSSWVLPSRKICYDVRRLRSLGAPEDRETMDTSLLHGGDSSLLSVVSCMAGAEFLGLKSSARAVGVHMRACRTAKVDLGKHPLSRLTPPGLIESLYGARGMAIMALSERASLDETERLRDSVMPLHFSLLRMEENGVAVDALEVNDDSDATARFLRSCESLRDDSGIARPVFSPVGSKTGRIRVVGGLRCMSIPHGRARRAVVSRFEGGMVLSFDYNAMDYRSLVRSVGGELAAAYSSADDFHTRTLELVLGKVPGDAELLSRSRDVMKSLAYSYMYGASQGTCERQTGLSSETVSRLFRKFDKIAAPIALLRERLWRESLSSGVVTLPDGRTIPLGQDAHPGKVLGLFAQTSSSVTFSKAIHSLDEFLLGRKSVLMFPVHDELVVDLHPDEADLVPGMVDALQSVDGTKVDVGYGKDYDEATSE